MTCHIKLLICPYPINVNYGKIAITCVLGDNEYDVTFAAAILVLLWNHGEGNFAHGAACSVAQGQHGV